MSDTTGISRAGDCAPYVVRAGQAPAFVVAGQLVHVLATTAHTAGAFGIVVCQSPRDRMAIPLHWHAREHDTWFCTRGRINVWGSGQGRVLYPGDFAYVPPGEVHAYQCVGQANAFFGLVAPGGWEAFFGDAGTEWPHAGVPPPDSVPFDFGRMVAAQGKHGVMRVEQPYPEIGQGADDALPGKPATYFLQAGHGVRNALWGVLFTRLVGAAETGGLFAMHVVDAPGGARLPPRRQAETLEAVYLLSGRISLSLNGEAHVLGEGDTAVIPPGTAQATTVHGAAARWISSTAGGRAADLYEAAGAAANSYFPPLDMAGADKARPDEDAWRSNAAALGIAPN